MRIPSAADVTSDERILAAVAHGSIILFGWGVIVAMLLWITQRQKSTFVAFHALQAVLYQLLQTLYAFIIIPLVGLLAICVLAGVAFFSNSGNTSQTSPLLFVLAQFAFIGSFFCGFGVYVLLGLAGALWLFLRRDFYYPLIGRRMEAFISDEPPSVLQ